MQQITCPRERAIVSGRKSLLGMLFMLDHLPAAIRCSERLLRCSRKKKKKVINDALFAGREEGSVVRKKKKRSVGRWKMYYKGINKLHYTSKIMFSTT